MTIRVLITYHYFPHYRLPILQELSQDQEIEYTFLSGVTTDGQIRIIEPDVMAENHIRWKEVPNLWLYRRKILWQVGLIRECLFGGYAAIIFLGSPYYLSTWLALILSRLFGKKTFLWAHAVVREDKLPFLKVLFYKLANGLLLYGKSARPALLRHGLSEENLFVVYNSLDYRTQLRLRQQLEPQVLRTRRKDLFIHPDNPVLLFVGRLTPEKKLHELIMACEQLHQAGLPVNLLFIGEGAAKQGLVLLTKDKQLQEYVSFFGECYDEKALSILIALADVCVSPGNVGLTCIHALTYGTPVITHDNPLEQGPEYEAISEGQTGMFFRQGSTDSLATAISKWLQANQNNRAAIRDRCYRIIDDYYNPAYQAQAIKAGILRHHSCQKRIYELGPH